MILTILKSNQKINIMTSWKTTLSGIACLGFACYLFFIKQTEVGFVAAAAGLGLLGAKDNNVTGGTKSQ